MTLSPPRRRALALALLLAWLDAETSSALAGPLSPSHHFFSVRAHRNYDPPQKALQRLVDEGAHEGEQHFCVVGYRMPKVDDDLAWIFWKEGNALLLWEQRAPGTPISLTRRILHIDRDIVATEDDLHGSTFRETRAWLHDVLADCRVNGEVFVVHPQRR